MFKFMMVCIFVFLAIGCRNQVAYSTIKTGPDRYYLTGNDPNQLQGNAFKACVEDGFDNYTILDSQKNSLVVRCEKNQQSILTGTKEKAEDIWNKIKNKIEAFQQQNQK